MLIGIIDSGIGGLEIVKRLSINNKYILIMDKAYFPYGNKSKEFLIKRTIYLIDYLINKGVDIIILGCNTLSITVLDFIKDYYNINIYGVFEFLIKYFNKNNIFIGSKLSSSYVKNKYNIDSLNVEDLIYLLEKNMKYIDVLDKYNNIFKMYDNVILGCTHLLKIPKEEYSVNSIDQIEEIKKVAE